MSKQISEEEVLDEPITESEELTPQELIETRKELDMMTKVESSSDDTVHSLIRSLDTDIDIESKTELNSAQIIAVSRALWKAEKYGLKSLSLFTLKLLKTTISKDRKGRDEKIKALTGALQWEVQKLNKQRVEL